MASTSIGEPSMLCRESGSAANIFFERAERIEHPLAIRGPSVSRRALSNPACMSEAMSPVVPSRKYPAMCFQNSQVGYSRILLAPVRQ